MDYEDPKVFWHAEHSKGFLYAKEPYDDPDRESKIMN